MADQPRVNPTLPSCADEGVTLYHVPTLRPPCPISRFTYGDNVIAADGQC